MPKRNLIWAVAIVAAALVALVFVRNHSPDGVSRVGSEGPVSRALRTIQESYLYEADEKELQREAVRAVVERLDPHSSYFPPGAAKELDDRIDGQAFGLGMYVECSGGKVLVIGPLPDSPAWRAGIQCGDQILEINGTDVTTLGEQEIQALLHPRPKKKNEPLELRIRRNGAKPPKIKVTPGEYPVESVKGLFRDSNGLWVYLLPDGKESLVYVRIREFLPRTQERVQEVLRRFDSARGVILDLRENPGGRLPIAIEVGNFFLRSGVIVVIETRSKSEQHKAASPGTFPQRIPMVVLVDAQTASGAELVAAALQYHDRAVLVGTRTRGKGCVQSMISLDGDLGQINLTTAEFYVDPLRRIARRSGSDVWGVDPHVEVILPPAVQNSLRRLRMRAEVLTRAASATRPASAETQSGPEEIAERLLERDGQIRRAVELLNHPDEMARILAGAAKARAARRQEHEERSGER
ncbi:MAG TPA: S41 family peptidase [Phycisphaerae bacterium]|nr:S41 family peptidase [Phycisphaerae bacterium]